MANYREYLKNQVREILTNYGKIDILWLDHSFPGEFGKRHDDWNSVELLKMVRQLQPGILVNDRLDLLLLFKMIIYIIPFVLENNRNGELVIMNLSIYLF